MKKLILSLIIFNFLSWPVLAGVDFDNTDDFLDCNCTNVVTGNMSIFAWIYHDTNASFDTIIEHAGGAPDSNTANNIIYNLGLNSSGRLSIIHETTSGSNISTNSVGVVSTSAWNHVGWVRDVNAGTYAFYINGSLDSTGTYSAGSGPLGGSSGEVNIGAEPVSGFANFFDGKIAEVAVWNSKLTATEIETLFKSRLKRVPLQTQYANLQMYYPLDERSDGVSVDNLTFLNIKDNSKTMTGNNGANNTGLTAVAEQILSYP